MPRFSLGQFLVTLALTLHIALKQMSAVESFAARIGDDGIFLGGIMAAAVLAYATVRVGVAVLYIAETLAGAERSQ